MQTRLRAAPALWDRERRRGAMAMGRKIPAWKKALLAPIPCLVLILLAEGGLRLAGYQSPVNDPYESFVRHRPVFEADGDLFRTSPARTKFFHDQSFPRTKPPDTFRFFAVGGSITRGNELGNPREDCFTAQLSRLIAGRRPSLRVEAINVGGAAYGSYRLTGIVEEVLAYSPDLVVVMCGSNEFLEPRHYADLMNPSGLSALLAGSRVVQLGRHLSARLHDGGRTGGDDRRYLFSDEKVEERYIVRDPGEIEATRAHYEASLVRMAEACRRAGVPVVLCTEGSNLRHRWPIVTMARGSLSLAQIEEVVSEAELLLGRGRADQALAHLREALAKDPGAADLHFASARALDALRRFEEAKAEYLLAKDTDGFPHRALSSFNDTVRRVAREQGVLLFDAEEALMRASLEGIPGGNLFLDQCHPNPAGHALIASGLLGVVTPLLPDR
jgi:lysophospholipase L1-like esterase